MPIHHYSYITKEIGGPIDKAEDMLWRIDDNRTRWIVGALLDVLMAKGVLSEADAYKVSQDGDLWYTVQDGNDD